MSIFLFYIVDEGKAESVEQSTNLLVKYDDFDPNEYWADNVLWMIDHGYFSGYINQKHPITGQYGTWLNPYGNLTESQMLSVLLRYEIGIEDYENLLKSVQSPSNFWSYPLYIKAQEFGIMTKGSPSDNSYQNQQVTRGQLAQALVSMHYGQQVSITEAIQFMFDNGISIGIDPSKGATIENFAPNEKLARAHIAAFLKRYDDVKIQGTIIDIPRFTNRNESDEEWPKTTPDSSQNSKLEHLNVVENQIKTKFGERSYGSKTQVEYDAIIEIVEREHENGFYNLEGRVQFGEVQKQAVEDFFFRGKTAIKDKNNPEYLTQYNQMLLGIEEIYGAFKGKVTSVDDVENLASLTNLFERYRVHINHDAYEHSNYGHDPVSAYDLVVKGLLDSTSEAYYNSAMLDQVGIDSFVLHSPERLHDFLVVNLYGNWYIKDNYSKALMRYVQLTPNFLMKKDQILYAPNVGIDALPKFLQDIYNPVN